MSITNEHSALVISILLAACTASQSTGSSFTLARKGRPACTIVVAADPTPAARLAALELQHHVLKITGADVPIATDKQSVTGPRVLVGESAATRKIGLRGSDFSPQEYLIAFRPETLILIGRDWEDTEDNRAEPGRSMAGSLSDLRHRVDYWKTVGCPQRSTGEIELPGVFDDQGTCYAAYDFLERFCGVRWYGPAQVNIVCPSRATLTIRGTDIRRAPALKHRSALWNGSWPFMSGQWGSVTRPEVVLYWRRLRLGGEKWAANHTFHGRTVESVFNDPAYQAEGPGRGSQLCYSHPKLVAHVARMARDFFDRKAEVAEGCLAVGDYFAIVPDDNPNFCRCAACRALLETGVDRATGQFSSGWASDYWFTFVNAVAREVGKTHPDKYIATLAYWCYAYPPRDFEIEANVSVAPCLHVCYYPVHYGIRDNDMRLYKGWLDQTKAPMFMWTYYHHPMEAGLVNGWKCFPHFMVHETARAMRMFMKDGIRGIFVCGEPDQLEAYVMVKLWDEPGQDVDGLMEEFFRLYFGGAAESMNKFYSRIEEIASDPANYSAQYQTAASISWESVAWEQLGTAERLEELGALIAEAEAGAQTELEKQRVALWREAIWQWMVDGRAQHLAR
ncbi:MAG: DUF4838 domain-containing protein [Armatimonadota bacterium]|nr:MAG: DUF4838 domain-containing protein [Armatimonadota bacterium]